MATLDMIQCLRRTRPVDRLLWGSRHVDRLLGSRHHAGTVPGNSRQVDRLLWGSRHVDRLFRRSRQVDRLPRGSRHVDRLVWWSGGYWNTWGRVTVLVVCTAGETPWWKDMLMDVPLGVISMRSITVHLAFNISASFCARRSLRRRFSCAFLRCAVNLALCFDKQLEVTVVDEVDRSSRYERSIAFSIRQSSKSGRVFLLSVQTSTGAFDVNVSWVAASEAWRGLTLVGTRGKN